MRFENRLVGIFFCCSLMLFLFAEGCGGGNRSRVLLLGIDGLDWDVISQLADEDKMPNLQKFNEQGACGKLKTIKPILSPVIWTSIATGKSPAKHEITFFTVENPQTKTSLPITSDLRKTKALWNICSERNRSVGVMGWWASWPAETVSGFVISDHANYHFLHEEDPTKSMTTGNTYPPELNEEIALKLAKPMELKPKDVRDFIHLEDFPSDGDFDFKDPVDHFRWAYTTAESYKNIGLEALKKNDLDLLMIYFEGTDTVSHLFGQYFRPDPETRKALGEDKVEAYGRVVEQFYIYADSIVGEFMAAMPEDMDLVVCSDHGFELKEGKGIAEGGAMEMKKISERAHKPYGVLFMKGPDIKQGAKISGAHVYDIAPTILALLGVAVPEDMDGRVLQQVLENPNRVVLHTDTYEGRDVANKPVAATSEVDPEILKKLSALGYIGGESDRRLSNLGNITLEEGNLDKALEKYMAILKDNSREPTLLSNIGTVYARQENYAEAEKYYREALSIDDDFAQGYSNLALVCERTNRLPDAIAYYLKAIVLDESLAEAKTGLERAKVKLPPDPTLRDRLSEAAELAKNNDIPAALAKIDEVLKLNPASAEAYHFQSNCFYLTKQKDKARVALEYALALEPANPLFRKNLEALSK